MFHENDLWLSRGGPMLQQRNLTLVFWIVCAPWRGNETFSFRNKSCKACILSSQRDYWQIYLEISPVSRIVGPVLFLMTLPTVLVKHPQRAINRNSLSTAHLSIASTPVCMYVQYLQSWNVISEVHSVTLCDIYTYTCYITFYVELCRRKLILCH